jgi:tetratricopeptide (TPR) repeat protein
MEANRWQEAEGLLDRAVVACPIDPDARRYYAEALLQRGATDEAISQLEEAIHLTPDDPALVIRAGEIYFYRGDHVEAQRWANEAINLDPTAVDAWALRGRIHHAGGRYRQALADFQRALGYRPEDVRLLSEVADVYMNLGRPGRTLLHLQNLEETHVSGEVPPDLMERKAEALTALGRYQEAAVCYRMVCQRVQPSAELYYNLAKAELRAGQMVRARVATQNALGIDPQHQPSTHLLSQLPASATPRR